MADHLYPGEDSGTAARQHVRYEGIWQWERDESTMFHMTTHKWMTTWLCQQDVRTSYCGYWLHTSTDFNV